MTIKIKEGTIEQALEIESQIPEFTLKYQRLDYEKRLTGKKHLILIAKINNKPVGFKVGYEKESDNSLYTWIGGVLPKYRRKGIADKLAQKQEQWAKKQGYNKIKLKTKNKFKNMLIFAISRRFKITKIENIHRIDENEIFLEKEL